MKTKKLIISLLVVVVAVGFIFYTESNKTIEDVIYETSSVTDNAPLQTMITLIEKDDKVLAVYETTQKRIGIAVLKSNNSIFNKYELLEVSDIDRKLFPADGINNTYNLNGIKITYGLYLNPDGVTLDELKEKHNNYSEADYNEEHFFAYLDYETGNSSV